MNTMDPHPVLALEQQRCEALVAGDIDRVAALLAPSLVYVHAPGLVHGREALLGFLREGVRFDAVERRGLVLQCAGEVAWLTGMMRLAGRRLPGGEPLAGCSFVSQVWQRAGGAWQMQLFQSTAVAQPLWDAALQSPRAGR